tara:strand:+ start:114 stop:491 length:378 start_codon:yes stop_codon:yes gene_type:complete
MLSQHNPRYSRKSPHNPIYSKYEGNCKVCGKEYFEGELISPFFDGQYNFWRHTDCLQLFYIPLPNGGECKECKEEIPHNTFGYWSKHNGVWCVPCGEKLAPKVNIAYSRIQREIKNSRQQEEGEY